MSWDFSTDPEFQEQLDWMQDFVRREIWPLETIWRELGGYEGLREALSPLQEQVKDRNLWAAHLPPGAAGRPGQRRIGRRHGIEATQVLVEAQHEPDPVDDAPLRV